MEVKSVSNKWISTAVSIWIQCICGSSYTFSVYSSLLKSSQGYDQSTLDTVSVFKDIGANAGVISGFLYSAVTPVRSSTVRFLAGPSVVHLAGAIQCFVGYIFVWAAVSGSIPRPPFPAMCFFMFLAAHAQTFFNTANVVTGVHNFSRYSGTIVGILKGFLGLSGALLMQVYSTVCMGEPSNYLLTLAVLPTFISLLFMWFVRIDKTESANETRHLNSLSVLSIVIAFYLMIIIILDNIVSLSLWTRFLTSSALLILLASPLVIAIKAQREDSEWSTASSSKLLDSEDSLQYHESSSNESQPIAVTNSKTLQDEQNINVVEAIRTVNFWLLFVAMICGMGSGLATINNMSQLGQSLGYTSTEIKTFVSLWSIWNFLGRFGAGYTSDILLHSYGCARPLLMAITLLIMSAGHIVITAGFSGNLYVGSIIVGICYGSQWSLMPTITSEIFGIRHMGTIYNAIAIASPLGSYIFSVRVIGYIYDREASGEGNSCSGMHCFAISFMVMSAVAFLGFLVAVALFFRTKRFYRAIYRRVERCSRL